MYEKKNIPKVIYCIHALSFVLVNAGLAGHIGDLVGKLEFSEEEIKNTQKSLDATGVTLPNFKNVGNAIAGEPETGAPLLENEEEKKSRLLDECRLAVVMLQACARGTLLRKRISLELQRLDSVEADVLKSQAQARGFLVRKQYYENAHTYREINQWTLQLQTFARALLLRKSTYDRRCRLIDNDDNIIKIQAVLRGNLIRSKLNHELNALHRAAQVCSIPALQAAMRGVLKRKSYKATKQSLSLHKTNIAACQAYARSRLVRESINHVRAYQDSTEHEIIRVQAVSRAYLARKSFNHVCVSLKQMSGIYRKLQAGAKGFSMRKKVATFRGLLESESESVVELQTLCRGMRLRMDFNHKLIALAEAEWFIVDLQAVARGALKRRAFDAKLQHYKRNMQRVIKVQSFIRARQQGAAYKSLTIGENPPVSTIKNFVHLLNDSNFDFEEEIAMEQVRKQIVQSVRQNESAEEHIEQMDIKIALLVKQAIKLDEVIQHQRKMDKGLALVTNDANPFDLKAMNKQARRQLENYQKLFYILQTQPVYLARLFTRLRVSGLLEKQMKNLETFVMVLYGYAQKRREEYHLVKLIRSSIIKEISLSQGVHDFVSQSYLWPRILSNYTKGMKESRYLRELLAPFVNRIVSDDFLDLESDPLEIYKTITLDEESRTGQQSRRTTDVTQEYAIQDPDTRVMFIKHLRDLRDLTERLMDLLEDGLNKMPFGVRYIAREAYRAMEEHLAGESSEKLEILLGYLVWHRYVSAAMIAPDQYGIINGELSTVHHRNLAEVAKMITQISSGNLFEEGDYLQPLNEFVAKSITRMSSFLQKVIQVPDAETYYNTTELDDVIATKKPILYIKAVDIFAIHSLLHQESNHIAPEMNDPLNEVLQSLGAPPIRAEDMTIMSISNSEIALTLDPKAIDVDDPEADERALFMQTKRYLLYIIRVQSGPSLMDILVEPVTEDDEQRWLDILQEERAGHSARSSPAYSDAVYQDISQMSYPILKRECLENIVKLERLGWITRENQYQELLNRIADDIRTQNRRRMERQHELNSARGTLNDLITKRRYLDGQLKSYNDYIEQAMMSLQSKKNRKKSILPFTKQYFHMRDLQKSGKVPKFGSRKYSASKLYDKRILISITNERPPFDKIDMAISSDRIGVFTIESSYAGTPVPGAHATILLDDLLQAQYNKVDMLNIYDGQVQVRVSPLLNLLFKHFFSQ